MSGKYAEGKKGYRRIVRKSSPAQHNLITVRFMLATASLLFFLCYSAYSYGFALVEFYRLVFPPEIAFGNSYVIFRDLTIGYLIVSATHAGYIVLLRQRQGLNTQFIGLSLLLISLYQLGFYSFITGHAQHPGQGATWAEDIFPPTVLYAALSLHLIFWAITLILIFLQSISIWREWRIRLKNGS